MALKAEALRLQAAGYAVMGGEVGWDPDKNKKTCHFKTGWQHAHPESCLQHYFNDGEDTALAIVTGESSDVLALDFDRPKPKDIKEGLGDAVKELEALLLHNHLHPAVPVASTPSGGKHLLFRLSSSLEAGLTSAACGSKLSGLTLDIRGDRGCLLCYPSVIRTPAGPRRYTWQTSVVPVSDLQPVPPWLLQLANQRPSPSKSLSIDPPAKRQRRADEDNGTVLASTVQRQLNKLGPNLQMARTWPRLGGVDFCLSDRTCSCPLCGNVHVSNNFRARAIVEATFILGNYSTSCRSQAFGWDACSLIKQVIASPNTDDSFCGLLMALYRLQQRTIVYTAASRFLSFNGTVWEPLHVQHVKRDIKSLILGVLTPLLCSIVKTEETAPKLKSLAAAKRYLEKAHNVSSIVQTFQTYSFDGTIEDELDTDPDLLAVADGVLHLPSGTLVPGKGSHRLSTQLTTSYVDSPTPMIDAFFADVFNKDADTIAYMQRLLGYGITGHTRAQVWAIWTGSGSNGKSLLQDILKQLLGPFAVMMPSELLFDTGKTTAGASTPHLQTLIKKRIGFKDESKADRANVLNEELIKTVTGSSTITTRPLYKDFIEFKPTHLPVLLCNKKPRLNILDAAMMRRIIVVEFPNKYTALDAKQDPYDSSNPTHRLRDDHLLERLSSKDGQEQLLTWLVHGAKEWYEIGLGAMPEQISKAFDAYKEENDTLATFIAESCTKEAKSNVNASAFLQAYNAATGAPIKQKALKELMVSKGFKYLAGQRAYKGLTLESSAEMHLQEQNTP